MPGIFIWGTIARGPGGRESTVGSRGKAYPHRLKQFALQTLFTDFDCTHVQNWKISHNLPPDFWPVCFTVSG